MINKKRKYEKTKQNKKTKDYVFIKIFSSVLVLIELKLVDSVEVGFIIAKGREIWKKYFITFWVHG